MMNWVQARKSWSTLVKRSMLASSSAASTSSSTQNGLGRLRKIGQQQGHAGERLFAAAQAARCSAAPCPAAGRRSRCRFPGCRRPLRARCRPARRQTDCGTASAKCPRTVSSVSANSRRLSALILLDDLAPATFLARRQVVVLAGERVVAGLQLVQLFEGLEIDVAEVVDLLRAGRRSPAALPRAAAVPRPTARAPATPARCRSPRGTGRPAWSAHAGPRWRPDPWRGALLFELAHLAAEPLGLGGQRAALPAGALSRRLIIRRSGRRTLPCPGRARRSRDSASRMLHRDCSAAVERLRPVASRASAMARWRSCWLSSSCRMLGAEIARAARSLLASSTLASVVCAAGGVGRRPPARRSAGRRRPGAIPSRRGRRRLSRSGRASPRAAAAPVVLARRRPAARPPAAACCRSNCVRRSSAAVILWRCSAQRSAGSRHSVASVGGPLLVLGDLLVQARATAVCGLLDLGGQFGQLRPEGPQLAAARDQAGEACRGPTISVPSAASNSPAGVTKLQPGPTVAAKARASASVSTIQVRPSSRSASTANSGSVSTKRSARPTTPGCPSRSTRFGCRRRRRQPTSSARQSPRGRRAGPARSASARAVLAPPATTTYWAASPRATSTSGAASSCTRAGRPPARGPGRRAPAPAAGLGSTSLTPGLSPSWRFSNSSRTAIRSVAPLWRCCSSANSACALVLLPGAVSASWVRAAASCSVCASTPAASSARWRAELVQFARPVGPVAGQFGQPRLGSAGRRPPPRPPGSPGR